MITESVFLLIVLLIGSFHMISPDHWVMPSLVMWKEKHGPFKKVVTILALTGIHVLFGVLLFFPVAWIAKPYGDLGFFMSTLSLILGFSLFRAMNLKKVRSILQSDHPKKFLFLAVYLGPAESLAPLLLRADQLGYLSLPQYFLMIVGFYFLGSLSVMMLMTEMFSKKWSSPYQIPKMVRFADEPTAIVPSMAGLAMLMCAVLMPGVLLR